MIEIIISIVVGAIAIYAAAAIIVGIIAFVRAYLDYIQAILVILCVIAGVIGGFWTFYIAGNAIIKLF